jgi:CPA1 family monovalent cation:H+ antiporter
VLNRLFPKLPLTLIQIAFGCLLSLAMPDIVLELEPEIFMVLVIAPLLFREAEETSLASLWRVKNSVFLMAFLLVFITVLAVGFFVHWMEPTIPLAACFALGGILGPTDVVAVVSLSSGARISERVLDILKGEGLINDASGIIAFHFAVAALMTGQFSLEDALLQLLYVSVVGILVGFMLVGIKRLVTDKLRQLMIHDTTAHMLIEILMPFLSYVVAEALGASGILAAVTAGSRQALDFKKGGLFDAEFGITKKTMWDMISFTLNSLVFLLLGLQFPQVINHIWNDPHYTHASLIMISGLVTLLLLVIRFFSVILFTGGSIGQSRRESIKNLLFLTLSGVKGAVSLATAFALPLLLTNGQYFTERPLLLFITSGVIIISLALALLLLPLIADPDEKAVNPNKMEIEILKEVIRQLRNEDNERVAQVNATADSVAVPGATAAGRASAQESHRTNLVIANYWRRIEALEQAQYNKTEKRALRRVRKLLYDVELSETRERFQRKEIGAHTQRDYHELLSLIYHMETKGIVPRMISWFKRLLRIFRQWRHVKAGGAETPVSSVLQHRHELQQLFRINTALVLTVLEELHRAVAERDGVERLLADPRAPITEAEQPAYYSFLERMIDQLQEEREDLAEQMAQGVYRQSVYARVHRDYNTELLKGYYVERRVIHQFLEERKINLEYANALRVNVNKLESYTLAHHHNDVVQKMLTLTESHRV